MSDQYLGEIRTFGFNFPPNGWALCQGQLLAISSNAALFSLLGTFYGGNGTTTFALPDLQGRYPINQGTGTGLPTYTIGEKAGSNSVPVLLNNMPSHTHLINCSSNNADQTSPVGAIPALTNDGSGRGANLYPTYTKTAANGTMGPTAISLAGGSVPLNVTLPYLCLNFCIALVGIYPTRA